MAKGSPAPVTRDDLEQGFAAVQSGIKGTVDDRKSTLVTVAAVGGVVLLLLVFLFGRRAGRRKSTFVEIRRV